MKNPKISVIITCYNNQLYIEEAIKSVADQDISSEVIVIDDHSTDNSWEFLQSIQPKYKFTLKRPRQNLGMAGARNFGFSFAKGAFINFLDGDDYLLPGKLKTQVEYLEAYHELSACFVDSHLLVGEKFASFKLSDVWQPHSGNIFTPLLSGNFIAIHAALFRAESLNKEPFDTTKRHAADYDFWLKFSRNKQIGFIDRPLVVYRRTGATNTVTHRLPLINETLNVLDRWDNEELDLEQKQKLAVHLSKTYIARAHYYFGISDPSQARVDLETANRLSPLRGKAKLLLKTTSLNKALGKALHTMTVAASRLKHSVAAALGRERKFV